MSGFEGNIQGGRVLKRTFIPPTHRPPVRGAKLAETRNHYLEILHDQRSRREFIVGLLTGRYELPGLKTEYVRHVLKAFFPMLRGVLK